LNSDEEVDFVIKAVSTNSIIDSLMLFYGSEELTKVAGDSLSYHFSSSDYSSDLIILTVVAKDEFNFTASLDFAIYILTDPAEITPPPGIVPGINIINSNSAILALFAPYKEHVFIIGEFNDWIIDNDYLLNKYSPDPDSTLWWIKLNDLNRTDAISFQYLVDGNIRIADPYTELVLDPVNDSFINQETYPNLKQYPYGLTEEPVGVIPAINQEFFWKYQDAFIRPAKEELVIYELLVRDFIENHDYATLMDTLDYLDRLGITAIELMPINEFEGNSSWGYNPSFYFAPDKYYGSADNLKEFIDECHKRGIAVIQDIVLNHSYGQSPLVRLYWDTENNRPTDNNPWYNVKSPNSIYDWGFDFNHMSEHTNVFVDRVLSYWMDRFDIDGFRLDFVKGFTNTKPPEGQDGSTYDPIRISIIKRIADEIWSQDSTFHIILELFAENAEEKELADYDQGMMSWGNANYNYNEATMGYHENGKSDFSWGYYREREWSKPHLVTYMESHDEERLMYKNLTYGNSSGSYDVKNLQTALDRIKLAAAFFLTLPGPKMIWQFGELGYDISIDMPSRTDEKPILWNYFKDTYRRRLYHSYSALLQLRNENEVFRSSDSSVDYWFDDPSGLKRIRLSHSSLSAIIIGNFGVEPNSINPDFFYEGKWYDYFTGDSSQVTDSQELILLSPGEFHIFTSKHLNTPFLSIDGLPNLIPEFYSLKQNYPNPFNPMTSISFSLPADQLVSLTIYDLRGRKVSVLADSRYLTGEHVISWDGRDSFGQMLPSGVYFYRLWTEGFSKTKKMILLR
jgi:1,4-alpha-glucan branching enzyme